MSKIVTAAAGGVAKKSQIQRHILSLYRQMLRAAKDKDDSIATAVKCTLTPPPLSRIGAESSFVLSSPSSRSSLSPPPPRLPVLCPPPPLPAAEFRANRDIPRKEILRVEFHVRKAEKDLKLIKSANVKSVRADSAAAAAASPRQ